MHKKNQSTGYKIHTLLKYSFLVSCHALVFHDKYPIHKVKDKQSSRTNAIRPRDYKTFFMLSSVEHEIVPAHKYNVLTCQQLLAF